MKGFSSYTRLREAIEIIISRINRVEGETVTLKDSLFRVTSSEVISRVNVPPFDRSAMDGYAIKAYDTFRADENNPVTLNVIGRSDIGIPTDLSVKDGKAVEIMTGAVIPEGADAIVKVEYTQRDGDEIKVFSPVSPGRNVSKKGEDVKTDQLVFNKGHYILPHDIGMLAAIGKTQVEVSRRPEIGVIPTGVELREPGESLKQGELTESNSYSIEAAVKELNAKPNRMKIISDELESFKKSIVNASDFDVMLVLGSTSVGKRDFAPEVIQELGELIFHGVTIRPGGPTAFGIVNDTPVFALAGFPVASLISFEFLVRPAIRYMQGLSPDRGRYSIKAKIGRKISSSLGRADIVRVKVRDRNGELIADPIRVTGSSVLSSMTRANGYTVIYEEVEGIERGREVEIELFC